MTLSPCPDDGVIAFQVLVSINLQPDDCQVTGDWSRWSGPRGRRTPGWPHPGATPSWWRRALGSLGGEWLRRVWTE